MRSWFSPIRSRDDALNAINITSVLFFLFAASEIAVAIFTSVTSAEVRRYAQVPSDAVFNYVATAGLIVFLAGLLRIFNSRLAAVALLLLSIGIFGFTAVNTASKTPSGNLFIAVVAIAVAIRAVQATVKFHDFANAVWSEASARPKPDFVSHPKAGLEATAQSYENRQRTTDYDEKKWAALLKYDDEIAAVAGRVRRLGDHWEDELARAYLILNDKSYLGRIEEKIFAEARGKAAR